MAGWIYTRERGILLWTAIVGTVVAIIGLGVTVWSLWPASNPVEHYPLLSAADAEAMAGPWCHTNFIGSTMRMELRASGGQAQAQESHHTTLFVGADVVQKLVVDRPFGELTVRKYDADAFLVHYGQNPTAAQVYRVGEKTMTAYTIDGQQMLRTGRVEPFFDCPGR